MEQCLAFVILKSPPPCTRWEGSTFITSGLVRLGALVTRVLVVYRISGLSLEGRKNTPFPIADEPCTVNFRRSSESADVLQANPRPVDFSLVAVENSHVTWGSPSSYPLWSMASLRSPTVSKGPNRLGISISQPLTT